MQCFSSVGRRSPEGKSTNYIRIHGNMKIAAVTALHDVPPLRAGRRDRYNSPSTFTDIQENSP